MAQKRKAPELQWLKILEGEFDSLFRDIQGNLSALSDCSEEARSLAGATRADVNAVAPVFSQLVCKTTALFQSNRKFKTMLADTTSELTRAKTQCELLHRELQERRLQVLTLELELRQREDLGRQREDLGRQREDLGRQREDLGQRQREDLGQRHHKIPSSLGTLRAQLELEVERYSQTPVTVERLAVKAAQLQQENGTLHEYFQHLHNELASSRLSTKYLQKELAGRIQQLQLLVSSGMKGEELRKLWLQINTEIALQQNKALLDAYQCRDRAVDTLLLPSEDEKLRIQKLRRKVLQYAALSAKERPVPRLTRVRTVTVVKDETGSMGITIAGGKEQGLPILVSNMEEGKPAHSSGGLQIGDAILSVNRQSLSEKTHRKATQLLQAAQNPVALEVAFVVGLDVDEEEDGNEEEEEEEEEEVDSGEIQSSSHYGKRSRNGSTPSSYSSDVMSANPPQSSLRAMAQVPAAQSTLSSSSSTLTSSTETLSSSGSSQTPASVPPAEMHDSERLASAFALLPTSPSSSSPVVDLSSVALFQYQDSDSADATLTARPSDSTLASATVSVPFKTPPTRKQVGSGTTQQSRASIQDDRLRPVSSHLSPDHSRATQTSTGSLSDRSSLVNLTLAAVPIQTLNLADFGDEDFPLFST